MTPFFTEDQDTYMGINQINDYLFISGLAGAMDKEEINKYGITAAIDLCETTLYEAHEGVDTYRYPLLDGPGNYLENIVLILETIKLLKSKRHKILVHCFAGVSRSGSICAAHLSQISGKPITSSVEEVKTARSCVDPSKHLLDTVKQAIGDNNAQQIQDKATRD